MLSLSALARMIVAVHDHWESAEGKGPAALPIGAIHHCRGQAKAPAVSDDHAPGPSDPDSER